MRRELARRRREAGANSLLGNSGVRLAVRGRAEDAASARRAAEDELAEVDHLKELELTADLEVVVETLDLLLVDQVIHPQSVLHKVIMEVLKLIQDVMVAVVVEQQQLELQIQAPMFLLVDQEQIFLLYMEQELEYQV